MNPQADISKRRLKNLKQEAKFLKEQNKAIVKEREEKLKRKKLDDDKRNQVRKSYLLDLGMQVEQSDTAEEEHSAVVHIRQEVKSIKEKEKITHIAKVKAENRKQSLLMEEHNSQALSSSKVENESLNLHMFDSTVLVQSIAAVWG